MYNKALLFKDDITAEMIMEAESPAEQKRLGRRVANFDEDVWKTQRCHLVREGNYYKFTAAVDEGDREMLKKVLLETGDKEIVEASPRDRIWGIGFGGKNAPANRHRWGLNLLGKALMEVRAQLVAEKEGEGKN
ncbi:MAG: hypothetical protein M1823_000428 [Watsoniomyces obsoletus]|nr:MAG: hypothetical protein M1823_000428 [Watsoniomyces obsoletus]